MSPENWSESSEMSLEINESSRPLVNRACAEAIGYGAESVSKWALPFFLLLLVFLFLWSTHRIISHGYLVTGHFPVRIALPTLLNMLLGPQNVPTHILLEAFLDFVSSHERVVFKQALASARKLSSVTQFMTQYLVSFRSLDVVSFQLLLG